MKKIISVIILICFILSFASCGAGESEKGLTEEQRLRYEEYAAGTGGVFAFLSDQLIDEIFVMVPEDMPAFLKANIGGISHLELDGAEALVVDRAGAVGHAYIVSNRNTVLYSYENGTANADAPVTVSSTVSTSPFGDTLSEIRMEYARTSVELDRIDAQYTAADILEKINALKEEIGDSYILDPRYIALETANPAIRQRGELAAKLYRCSLYMEQQEALSKGSDSAMTGDEIEFIYEMEIAKRTLQGELSMTEQTLASVQEAALAALTANDAAVSEIKTKTKEKNYMDDILFYQLCESNNDLKTYANNLRLKEEQESFLKVYDEIMDEPENIALITMEKSVALADNHSLQNMRRTVLAQANLAEKSYREAHVQEIAEYETAATEIKARYSGTLYEEDIDYLKLNIVHEDLLNELEKREADVNAAELSLQDAIAGEGELEAEKNLAIEAAVIENSKAAETILVNDFLMAQTAAIIADAAAGEGPSDEEAEADASVLPGWEKMSEEFLTRMNAERKIYTPAPRSSSYSGGSGSSDTGMDELEEWGIAGKPDDSTDINMDDFEEWLKEEDPENYEFYKDLEEGWDALDE